MQRYFGYTPTPRLPLSLVIIFSDCAYPLCQRQPLITIFPIFLENEQHPLAKLIRIEGETAVEKRETAA
jgi:hypothetical protein